MILWKKVSTKSVLYIILSKMLNEEGFMCYTLLNKKKRYAKAYRNCFV